MNFCCIQLVHARSLIFRFQWFSYLGMAFRLLRIDTTLKFWFSVYFIGHLSLPVFYVIGVVAIKPIARALFVKKHKE